MRGLPKGPALQRYDEGDTPRLAASLSVGRYSPAAVRSYKSIFGYFERWCQSRGLNPLPTGLDVLSLYLCELAPGYKLNTLKNVVSAVTFVNRMAGFDIDRKYLGPILRGIARVHGAEMAKAVPLEIDELRELVAHFPRSRRGLRDKAICLVAFAAALRAQEIVRLDYRTPAGDALGRVLLDRRGATIEMHLPATAVALPSKVTKYVARGLDPCPVQAVEDWVFDAGIKSGPLFRAIDKGGNVGEGRLLRNGLGIIIKRAIKEAAVNAGRSEADAARLASTCSPKSLRVGFIKSALEVGVSHERLALHMGWTTTQMVEAYKRRYQPLAANPLRKIFCIPPADRS